MKNFIFFVATLLYSHQSFADAPLISVAVGQARVKKSIAAFPLLKMEQGEEPKVQSIRDIIMNDLNFSGLIDFLDAKSFVENKDAGIAPGTFKMQDWAAIGAELVIKGQGSIKGKDLSLDIHLYAVGSGKELLAKRYEAKLDGLRKLAHTASNDIMFALTGKKGPFTAKIAFVSDKTGRKEVYVMDYDGFNPIKITPHFSLALFPTWNPDGKTIVFTADTKNAANVRNHNLFEYKLATGRTEMLSNRTGLNTGAVYSPDGKKLALTMSFTGHASIFLLDPVTKSITRVTNSYGLDVDPSWSPDAKQIAFVSDRSGKSMVYKMNIDGSNVQRLTYAGQYNASPSWSPSGDKIAFAGWNEGAVDIFIMDTDGSNIERLTKTMGDNEDPSFAPDGYFIAYSSNRTGKRNIFITNVDNTIHKQVTSEFGNCETPHWGPAD